MLALAAVLSFTRSPLLGDTSLYANEVAPFVGKSVVGAKPIWEFGHLLWRPIGWALVSLASPFLSAHTSWTPAMQVIAVLIAVNILCTAVALVLCYWLLLDFTGSAKLAWLLALAVLFVHGVLLYAHSGSAYVPGLAALLGSVYLLRRGRVGWGAVCYALAAAIWFPYILVGLALLLMAACSEDWSTKTFSWKRAAVFVAVAALVLVVLYGSAMKARGIASVQDAKQWYAESPHGVQQSIRIVRLATALPRSFLFLGRDGVLYRRFLFRDPMSPVHVLDLVKASLWKIAAFFFFLLCVVYELLRRRSWPAVVLLAAAIPVLFFAVFLFEPSSPERYFPVLPFLWLALAWILRDFGQTPHSLHRFSQWVIVIFLIGVALNNTYSFARPLVSAEDEASLSRIRGFRWNMPPSSVLMIATNQDVIDDVMSRSPFGAINRPTPLPIFDILLIAGQDLPRWRQRFAERALQAWDEGGEVWVTKRLWEPRAQPGWYWVEGEDQRVSWKDLHPYFDPLAVDADQGGPDGFRRLTRNEANHHLLLETLAVK